MFSVCLRRAILRVLRASVSSDSEWDLVQCTEDPHRHLSVRPPQRAPTLQDGPLACSCPSRDPPSSLSHCLSEPEVSPWTACLPSHPTPPHGQTGLDTKDHEEKPENTEEEDGHSGAMIQRAQGHSCLCPGRSGPEEKPPPSPVFTEFCPEGSRQARGYSC